MGFIWYVWILVRAFFISKARLAMENLVLRQQIAVLKRNKPRPKFKNRDRLFWMAVSKLWKGWSDILVIVQPETVLKWHRKGFKLFWRLKSCKKAGRPTIDPEIRKLIRQLSKENPTWGVPHIKSELALIGYDVAESTVAKYMFSPPKPPYRYKRVA